MSIRKIFSYAIGKTYVWKIKESLLLSLGVYGLYSEAVLMAQYRKGEKRGENQIQLI